MLKCVWILETAGLPIASTSCGQHGDDRSTCTCNLCTDQSSKFHVHLKCITAFVCKKLKICNKYIILYVATKIQAHKCHEEDNNYC